jgi:putative ABC transport system permease protein
MLPFGYAIRNLFRDPQRLLQAVLGSGLVVLLLMGAAAVTAGMDRVLSASGSPENVLLIGTGSEESIQRSEVADSAAGIAEASIPGILEVLGTRAVSPEIHHMTYVQTTDGVRAQILTRGVSVEALLVHPEVSLLEGTFPVPGEIMIGRLFWKLIHVPEAALKVGDTLSIEGRSLRISGIFAAPGTVMESELWADLNDLRTLAQRDSLSAIVLRMSDADFSDIDLFTKQRIDLELVAIPERQYYENLSAFYAPIRGMTWLTAALIAAGALLGGLNTLYAAFASRIAELATLQTIGYGRPAIVFSLIQESMMASLLGTLIAALLAVGIFDGLVLSFSMGSFDLRITPDVAFIALIAGVALGIIGAIPPALRCLLPPLPHALRAS